MAGVLAAAFLLAAASAPARAAEDDDEAFDQKIFRNLLEGMGLRKDGAGIEYRERSPLVVPPSRNLPPPDTGAAVEQNPAWPVDPDVKRRKDAKAAAAKTQYFTSDQIEADAKPLKPDQLRKGALPRSQQQNTTSTVDADASGRPMKPSALGYTSGIFGSLLGVKKDEFATFTAEPRRLNLTEPPPGYQTPSPNQPYGLKQNAEKPKPFDIKDKGIDNK